MPGSASANMSVVWSIGVAMAIVLLRLRWGADVRLAAGAPGIADREGSRRHFRWEWRTGRLPGAGWRLLQDEELDEKVGVVQGEVRGERREVDFGFTAAAVAVVE